jgi:hypothetical protein
MSPLPLKTDICSLLELKAASLHTSVYTVLFKHASKYTCSRFDQDLNPVCCPSLDKPYALQLPLHFFRTIA